MERPRYQEVATKIRAIKKLVAKRASPETFVPLYSKIFTGCRLIATTIENQYLYRARWNEGSRLFSSVSDLIYPPATVVRRKGRLNDIGESVFYGSVCRLGTIIELRPRIGELFTISVFRSRSNDVLFAPIGFTDGRFQMAQYTSTERMIHEYCNEMFGVVVLDEDEYNASIGLSRFFFQNQVLNYSDGRFAGVAYPSVQSKLISNGATYNIALLPAQFDKHFVLESTGVFLISNEDTHYELNELNKATATTDGTLQWEHDQASFDKRIKDGLRLDNSLLRSTS